MHYLRRFIGVLVPLINQYTQPAQYYFGRAAACISFVSTKERKKQSDQMNLISTNLIPVFSEVLLLEETVPKRIESTL